MLYRDMISRYGEIGTPKHPTNDLDMRMKRGMEILQTKTITENQDVSFSVLSHTHGSGIVYGIRLIKTIWVCTCPNFEYREIECCKYMEAAKLWIANNIYLKEKPKPKVFADYAIPCDRCGSIRVIEYGKSQVNKPIIVRTASINSENP
jgi:hypothetical protein